MPVIDLIQSSAMTGIKARLCFMWHPL